MPVYASGWGYEAANIVVDTNGVFSLKVSGRCQQSKTVIESAGLLSFDKIQKQIADTIGKLYGAQKMDATVISIALGSSLISAKDDVGTGCYVPSWFVNFTRKNGTEDMADQIIISAADGSYIEPRVTWADINIG